MAALIAFYILTLSRIRHAINRRKHPLAASSDSGGSYITVLRKLNGLGLSKVIIYGGKVRFALEFPGWPSRAFNRMAGRGGFNLTHSGTGSNRHNHSAFLSITSSCPLHCQHCYERDMVGQGEAVPITRWKEVVQEVQKLGVAVIVLTGGEPMSRFDGLIEILSTGNKDLSEFHIHTSGQGVTVENARRLKGYGLSAAGIGFDHWDRSRFDELRGLEGAYEQALEAARCFHQVGIFTYLNVCLTKELVDNNGLPKLLDVAKTMGAGMVRFLDPKPVGGYFGIDSETLFPRTYQDRVVDFALRANKAKEFRNHPLIISIAFLESPDRLGCGMGGNSIFYVDSRGNVTPCVFLPLTFGNILTEDVSTIFDRMCEEIPSRIRTECPASVFADILHQRVEEGCDLPVPHRAVKDEFQALFARDKRF